MAVIKTQINRSPRTDERGNVLFLILVAVVLFAALAYASTQTTHANSDRVGNETALINSTTITQYPATVRTAVVRMIIGGVDLTNLQFNAPNDFSDLDSAAVGVFHPQGGAATYMHVPPSLMANGLAGRWYFNMEFEIEDIGTSAAGNTDGNELVAFLPGITRTLCEKVNEELGITGAMNDVPGSPHYKNAFENMDDQYALPAGETVIGPAGAPGLFANLVAQPYGCYRSDTADQYVYYHVLLER